MNYWEKHIGDWISDTVSLSMREDGAYNRLADQYYRNEKPLPADTKQIYKMARAVSPADRKAVDTVLSMFFDLETDGYTQKRIKSEICKYQDKQDKARKSAAVRWSDKHANAMPTHMPTHTEGNAHQTPDTRHQTPIERQRLSPSASLQAHPIANANGLVDNLELTSEPITKVNGTVPDCPYSQIAEAYHTELPELPSIVVLTTARKRTLQARWREVCTADHLDAEHGIEFFRDFFRRIKQSEFLIGKATPKPGGRSFRADFDWIFNPANFIKIVEGRYHGRPH